MSDIFNPLLVSIAIEINSFCNRKCLNCPNHDYIRPVAFLESDLFHKIVDELGEMKYKGRFTFNLFNEPMLDKRLPEFIAYVKQKLPAVFINLNTNGDLLDRSTWLNLRASGLDSAIISQYDRKVNENMVKLLEDISDEERKHMFVRVFDIERDCSNVGGLIKVNNNIQLPQKKSCWRPFHQLAVNYKGNVQLCCVDYFSSTELGDLRKQSIREIWKSIKFAYYRFWLINKRRDFIKLCKACDNTQVDIPTFPVSSDLS
ncbi:MAG: radical SAM/SPASM domain-containing protein [Dehalococcoidia bacterium]